MAGSTGPKTSRTAAVTAPFAEAFGDIGARRYPRVLLFSVVCWVVVGFTLITCLIGQPTTTIDDPTTAAVQNVSGQIAPSALEQWFVPTMPWIGVVVVLAAVVLFVGVGWARLALTVLGILGVVGLAQAQLQWQSLVAALFVVAGAILFLMVSSHRYLNGTAPADGSEPGTPSGSASEGLST